MNIVLQNDRGFCYWGIPVDKGSAHSLATCLVWECGFFRNSTNKDALLFMLKKVGIW